MKRFFVYLIIFSAVTFALAGCKLDGENSIRQTIDLNLTDWDLPNAATESTPFNLVLNSSTNSSCYGKIDFKVENHDGMNYVFAQSIYDDSGDKCITLTTLDDSTVTITITQSGKYYYYFLKNYKWNKDSIIVTP